MKRIYNILLIAVLLFSAAAVKAQKISVDEAKTAASHYLKSMGKTDVVLESIRSVEMKGRTVAYIANFKPSSFVVLPAERQATPVLAYSLHHTAPASVKNDAFDDWMYSYGNQVIELIKNHVKVKPAESEWEALLAGTYVAPKGKSVTPLLTTTWDQGQYYNHLCPAAAGGPGGHVWAGCVATAMGQVMKYHNHPEQGTGSHSYNHPVYGYQFANFGNTTYNWAGMPNAIYSYDDDIALLLYHCAVSVDMDFGVDGSGASPSAVVPAVKNYFGYSLGTQMKNKNSYSTSEWIDMLKEELDNSRPLFSGGYNSTQTSGHAYVCDGYNANNYFHFNWGWSGYYNGYFNVNNLNPGGSNFSYNQSAIFYMEPAGESFAYLSLQSNLAFINPNPLEQGNPASLPSQVKNTGLVPFNGCVYLSLYDLDGNFVGDIDSKEVMVNPDATKTIVFSNPDIEFPIGTYELRMYYQYDCDGEKLLVESGNYTNPYQINLIDPDANMAPILNTLEVGELGAPYAGNFVENDDNWTSGIFQIKYTDFNGDAPSVKQVQISTDNGATYTAYDMVEGEGANETGIRYSYTYNYGSDENTYAGQMYKFNFNDGNLDATGEQGVEYHIPYLKETLQEEDTVTGATITFKTKYYHEGGDLPFAKSLFIKAPGGDTWAEVALEEGEGSVETGKWYQIDYTLGDEVGDWSYKFVFSDTKTMALGNGKEYGFHVDYPTAVAEILTDDDFFVYPNPVKDVLHIETSYRGSVHYQVIDASGRTLLQGNIENSACLPLNGLSKGTYILQLKAANSLIHRLLVK